MTITMLAADTLARTSTTEAVAFWILGAIAVAGAIGVVAAPKAVYSAMFLAATMIAMAMIYVAQDALFLGVHGMDAQAGFTTPNLLEAETNRAFMASARSTACCTGCPPSGNSTRCITP